MFKWLFRRLSSKHESRIASQPPGEVFPWVAQMVLTALDDVTFALPAAILGPDEPIGSVIVGDDDMEFAAPPGQLIYLRLRPGMSVSLTKSCQGYIVAEDATDTRLRRFRVRLPTSVER